MKIAITGKIGSGKSSLARALAKELASSGYELADVDAFSAACYLDESFRSSALGLFGTCEREEVSKAAFADPAKRSALESASMDVWTRLLGAALAKPKLILDFPLLMESQLALPAVDLAIGVDAATPTRMERACARLGWDKARFESVDALQLGSRAKMAFCDMSFGNDAGPEALEEHAKRLARNVRALDAIEGRLLPLLGLPAWRNVARAHCEPHRRYHGAAHLQALFEHIDPAFAADPACALAIAYHDFHYDAGAGYALNESLSCRALSRDLRDHMGHLAKAGPEGAGLPSDTAALACAMIDCTKGHAVVDPWILANPSRLARAQAFLDADLSILGGSPQEAFDAYDEAIGEEFAGVERPLYHRLRAQAMGSFLDAGSRPRIYLTERCRPWEAIARSRLSALVDRHGALADAAAAPVKKPGAPS